MVEAEGSCLMVEAEGGRWSGNGMRREAEGGRLSGNGIGGEFPASCGVASGGESWGVASGREAWGVASKTQTSCPLALEKSGGETWALWFVLFLKQKKNNSHILLSLQPY